MTRKDESICLRGFATIEVVNKKARKGRNHRQDWKEHHRYTRRNRKGGTA